MQTMHKWKEGGWVGGGRATIGLFQWPFQWQLNVTWLWLILLWVHNDFFFFLRYHAAHSCRNKHDPIHMAGHRVWGMCAKASAGVNSINKLRLSGATLMMCIDITALNVSRPLAWLCYVLRATLTEVKSAWIKHEVALCRHYDMKWCDVKLHLDDDDFRIKILYSPRLGKQWVYKYTFLWHIVLHCYCSKSGN